MAQSRQPSAAGAGAQTWRYARSWAIRAFTWPGSSAAMPASPTRSPGVRASRTGSASAAAGWIRSGADMGPRLAEDFAQPLEVALTVGRQRERLEGAVVARLHVRRHRLAGEQLQLRDRVRRAL